MGKNRFFRSIEAVNTLLVGSLFLQFAFERYNGQFRH